MSRFTVLMRTKNNDWVIRQTLASLFSQSLKFDIRVIDSGSEDSTLDILNSYKIRPVKISPSSYIPGKVINDALESINTEFIIMLNSDSVLLEEDSLKRLVQPLLDNKNCVATVGRQLPRHDSELWVRRDYSNAFPGHSKLPDYIHLSFPLSAFRKSVWEKEKFYTASWGSEDSEWGKRIKEKSLGEILYVPEAITMHSHNYTLKQLYGRKFIEGEADFFIYQKRPSLLKMVQNIIIRSLRESLYYLKNINIFPIVKIPIRNIVYFWGEYQGLRSARKRLKHGDDKVILKDYQ